MAYLDISTYKEDIIQDILKTPSIINALESKSANYDPDSPDTLIYENIFPHIKIPSTQLIAQTYILMAVNNTNIVRGNEYFTNIETTLRVLTHENCMRMKGVNGTRIDYIGNELKKLFAGQIKFGFGKYELIHDGEYVLADNNEFQYRDLVFHNVDARYSALRGDY